MKIRVLLLLISIGFAFTGCKEEFVGQTPVHGNTPANVTNIRVENTPGGAIITYDLPDESDLLYVKAEYEINGVPKTVMSSMYNQTLEVAGFGTVGEYTIHLYSVDRSQNESEATPVKINPLTPPVQSIMESLRISEDFGGIHIAWENETGADVVIYLMAADSIGDMGEVDAVYTSIKKGQYKLRGFDDSERLFGVYIRDRWDNYSDTVYGNFTPLFEEFIPKGNMKRFLLMGDNNTHWNNSASYYLERMLDDNLSSIYHSFYMSDPQPQFFTIDLGVTCKLSRFKMWHRQGSGYYYKHYNPKRFMVFGTDNPRVDIYDEDYWWWGGFEADWPLQVYCETIKPSGLEDDTSTQEDREFADAGFDFEFPADAPPVRYLRFRIDETWGGGLLIHIAELSFWGVVIEE